MAERYSRLFALPENQYTAGAPILIAAGALLKDNQTGRVLAQLMFKSVSQKQIKAVKISVSAWDVFGKELEGVAEYQYLDLDVERNTEFGQKQAVKLPDAVTRSFAVKCTDVLFADGSAWSADPDAHWDVLPKPANIADKLGSLAAQYQRDTSTRSKFVPEEHQDLWFCSCGALNHEGEDNCHTCKQSKEKLFAALNLETLDQRNEEYKAAEAEKTAKQAQANKIQLAKTKKLAIIAAAVISVLVIIPLVVTLVIIPNVRYNDAVALMEAGDTIQAYEALIALDGYRDSASKANSIYDEYQYKCKLQNAQVGDYILFGAYEQDNNTTNGKEKIEWLVLDKQDNRLLVISKYALDCQPYNTSETEVTWENCTLHEWLNNDFLSAAFSGDEKAMIPVVTVPAHENPTYHTDPGKDTQDQVFLLSINEANKYFGSDSESACMATDYADANGVWTSSNGACYWWLRSPGYKNHRAASVSGAGDISGTGRAVDDSDTAIRPALWIDLSKIY